jgi:WD40 repeat protein
VAGADDEAVTVWPAVPSTDPAAPAPEPQRLTPHPRGATDVAVLDDSVVAVATRDGSVRLWDLSGPQATPLGEPIPVHDGELWHVVAVDGRSLVTAGADGTVQRIDVLDPDVACAAAAWSFDGRQQARSLGSEPATACGGGR